jgi:Uma2 family endonuclease
MAKAGQKMTFEAYLKAFDSVEGVQAELVGGEVRLYPVSNNLNHQDIVLFLAALVQFFLTKFGLGRVSTAGYPMRLGDEGSGRQPDILVVLTAHLARMKAAYLDGAADVVVEVVSPESGARDRGEKFEEYEAAGVPEYWLIDPIRTTAQFFALSEDKHYRPLPLDGQGRLTSNVLEGFALDPQILWEADLLLKLGPALAALVEAMPRREQP